MGWVVINEIMYMYRCIYVYKCMHVCMCLYKGHYKMFEFRYHTTESCYAFMAIKMYDLFIGLLDTFPKTNQNTELRVNILFLTELEWHYETAIYTWIAQFSSRLSKLLRLTCWCKEGKSACSILRDISLPILLTWSHLGYIYIHIIIIFTIIIIIAILFTIYNVDDKYIS